MNAYEEMIKDFRDKKAELDEAHRKLVAFKAELDEGFKKLKYLRLKVKKLGNAGDLDQRVVKLIEEAVRD